MRHLIYIFITFFSLTFLNVRGQTRKTETHSLDSCSKCYCTKYHRTNSIDTLTKEKVITLFRQKGRNCRCNVSDGYCKYKSITTQYYKDSFIHIQTIKKGWANGWGGEYKSETIYYNEKGKKTFKTINIEKRGKKIEKKIDL